MVTLTVQDHAEEADVDIYEDENGEHIVDDVNDEIDDTDSVDDAPVTPEAPPTPPAADSPSLPSWVETYINETRELESRAAAIAVEVERIKEDLKSAKQHYEDAVNELRQLVRRGPDRQQRLPFPDDDQLPIDPTSEIVGTIEETDDSWKPTPIVELDLPQPIKDKLLDAGISTVGELADYTAQGNQLIDIKGIGAAKAEKIEAVLEKFWESRNS